MKQLIEDRYIGAKVGDTIGVVDRRGFIAPDGGGGGSGSSNPKLVEYSEYNPSFKISLNLVLEVRDAD